jgi:hypothetical protein
MRQAYRAEHERSVEQRVLPMPKTLDGLLSWYQEQCALETPVDLHRRGVWSDRPSGQERTDGYHATGGSALGAPAYAEEFRRRLENGPSQVDEADTLRPTTGQTYFMRPVAAALSRMGRNGQPLMARHLLHLAAASFDWHARARTIGWAYEEYEVYLREALIRLWHEFREWVRAT